jgi:hypothetical protein
MLLFYKKYPHFSGKDPTSLNNLMFWYEDGSQLLVLPGVVGGGGGCKLII